ncbi:MAG: DUF1059 domain-containing protein [Candidatus Taylorbacteria bacterium RIFCSPHIGHO2_12_FULL_42_34]|nr:MAG: DUF1059 domain-containing protein [Candidatus Taylorbacteria bacterium RIFCSPHIGHO2_12_FULL_42_34]
MAQRKAADCRTMPSEKNCSLYISGTEVEVMSAAVAHAIADHGHKDTQELRAEIKSGLKDVSD